MPNANSNPLIQALMERRKMMVKPIPVQAPVVVEAPAEKPVFVMTQESHS